MIKQRTAVVKQMTPPKKKSMERITKYKEETETHTKKAWKGEGRTRQKYSKVTKKESERVKGSNEEKRQMKHPKKGGNVRQRHTEG